MTRPRSVAFRSLVVHRPDQASPPARPAARAPSDFEALLRRRPAPAAAPRPLVTEADDAHAPPARPTHQQPQQQQGGNSGDEDSRQGEDAEPADWASALVPTAESLDSLLVDAVPAVAPAADAPQGVLEAIAQTIATFCNERSVDDSDGWKVRIPLRPEILEETTLEVAISAYWLQLRFLTSDPRSRQLISEHQDALRELLTGLLNRQRDISITIE